MIKVNDVFTKDGVNYKARVIVCDVVVAVNLDAAGLEFGIFTMPEIC